MKDLGKPEPVLPYPRWKEETPVGFLRRVFIQSPEDRTVIRSHDIFFLNELQLREEEPASWG